MRNPDIGSVPQSYVPDETSATMNILLSLEFPTRATMSQLDHSLLLWMTFLLMGVLFLAHGTIAC